MSDYDIPELPSDEDLGITEDDIAAFEEEQRDGDADAGEASQRPPASTPPAGGGGESPPSPPEAAAAPPRPAPLAGMRGPLTLVCLILVAVVSSGWWALPRPVPANAPDTAFSSARAMTHLVEIARTLHPPGSPEHARVRDYLVDALRDLGLDPTVQTTTSVRGRESWARAVTVRNIVARIPGERSTGAVLITAHYDGREISHAAADDGMGVVTILEAVRAVLAGPPLANDVIILITDAEELGLMGARAFAAEHPWMDDVEAVISIEMRGGGGPSIMFETGTDNGWIVRRLAEGDPAPFANSLGYEVYRRMPNDTDFTPLKEAGKQGVNFAAIGRAHLYHQPYDTPEHVSEATLQHHGMHALGMLRTLGNADLANVRAPDVVYFSVPFVGLVVYDVRGAMAGGILLAVLALLATFAVRRTARPLRAWLAGLGLSLLAGGLAWAAGWGLWQWLPSRHPEFGSLHGSAFHSEGWYVLSLVALAVAVVTFLFGLARRRLPLLGLTLGALTVWWLAALVASFLIPMGAMNLQWPVVAAVLASLAAGRATAGRTPGWTGWILTLVLAAPAVYFSTFLIEFLWLGMTFAAAPWLAVLAVVSVLLVLPALDVLAEPNRWWAPALGVAACAAFLGIGLLHATPSPERPRPTTLSYAMDRSTGDAYWITRAQEGAATAESLAWAEVRVGAQFVSGREAADFIEVRPSLAQAPAPPVETAAPAVALAADTIAGGERVVRLAVRSDIGAELLIAYLPQEGGAAFVGVNGRPLQGGATVKTVQHWGTPEGSILLDVRVPPLTDELALTVAEHHYRPWELVGEEPFQRPPDMAPDITTGSDRAVLRTELTIPLSDGTGDPGAAPAGAPGPASEPAPGGPERPDSASARPDTTAGGAPIRSGPGAPSAVPPRRR